MVKKFNLRDHHVFYKMKESDNLRSKTQLQCPAIIQITSVFQAVDAIEELSDIFHGKESTQL